ncbi:MAG: FUSC family protein [Steroidobacteraceae bacterium]
MSARDRFLVDDLRGVHYAVSLFIATTILWFIVGYLGDTSPIWAVSSMVATSDPQVTQALQTFRGRILNTLLGCAVGLFFIAVGHSHWELPFAMAVTVLISSYAIRIPAMWRQAPITAAIVIAGGLQHHEKLAGFELGVQRVGEVLLGCVVGVVVAWGLSKVWPLPPGSSAKKDGGGG